jgi:hypothetical protein
MVVVTLRAQLGPSPRAGLEFIQPCTSNTSRLFYLLALALQQSQAVLLTGPPMCGKSSVVVTFGNRLSRATMSAKSGSWAPPATYSAVAIDDGEADPVEHLAAHLASLPSRFDETTTTIATDDSRSTVDRRGAPQRLARRRRTGPAGQRELSSPPSPRVRGRRGSDAGALGAPPPLSPTAAGAAGVRPRPTAPATRPRSVSVAARRGGVASAASGASSGAASTSAAAAGGDSFTAMDATSSSSTGRPLRLLASRDVDGDVSPESLPSPLPDGRRPYTATVSASELDGSGSGETAKSQSVVTAATTGTVHAPSRAYFARQALLCHSTSLEQLQRKIEGVLERFTGSVFGVPSVVGLSSSTDVDGGGEGDGSGGDGGDRRTFRSPQSSSHGGNFNETSSRRGEDDASRRGSETADGDMEEEDGDGGGVGEDGGASDRVQKSILLLLDDVSLPGCDEWGTWKTGELLRQIIERGGYYTCEKGGKWHTISGLQLIATARRPTAGSVLHENDGAAPPLEPGGVIGAGGSSSVAGSEEGVDGTLAADVASLHYRAMAGGTSGLPSRLLAQFFVLHAADPSPADVVSVMTTTLRNRFRTSAGFSEDVALSAELVLPFLTMRMWASMRKQFRPSPVSPHCRFSLADISRVVDSVCSVSAEEARDVLSLVTLWYHECERELLDKTLDAPAVAHGKQPSALFSQAAASCLAAVLNAASFGYRADDARAAADSTVWTGDAAVREELRRVGLASLVSQMVAAPRSVMDSVAHAMDAIQGASTLTRRDPGAKVLFAEFAAGTHSAGDLTAATHEPFFHATVEKLPAPLLRRLYLPCRVSAAPASAAKGAAIVSIAERLTLLMNDATVSGMTTAPSLVLFEQVCFMVCRIAQLLRVHNRHAILLGVGGSGKRSAARLAAYVAGKHAMVIDTAAASTAGGPIERCGPGGEPTGNNADDLRAAIKMAGVSGRHVAVVVSEESLTDPGLLQCINVVLSTGDAASLFTRDELVVLLSESQGATLGVHGALDRSPDSKRQTPLNVSARGSAASPGSEGVLSTRRPGALPDSTSNRRSVGSTRSTRVFFGDDGGAMGASEPRRRVDKLAAAELLDDPTVALRQAFNDRVAARLHLVLCVSPTLSGSTSGFRGMMVRFPAIGSSCTIEQLLPWPHQARVEVARAIIAAQSWTTLSARVAEPRSPTGMKRGAVQSDGGGGAVFAPSNDGTVAKVAALLSAVFHSVDKQGAPAVEGVLEGTITPSGATMYASTALRVPPKLQLSVPVTPRSFLLSVAMFGDLLYRRQLSVTRRMELLRSGLSKLDQAAGDIAAMKLEMAAIEVELKAKSEYLDGLLAEVSQKTDVAETERRRIEDDRTVVSADAQRVRERLTEVEMDLSAAQPAVDAALLSLKGISPSDIATLRTAQSPPPLLKRILDGVLIILRLPIAPAKHDTEAILAASGAGPGGVAGPADDTTFIKPSWHITSKLLTSTPAPAFLRMLTDLPLSSINDETVELLRPYLEMPDFEEKSARFATRELAGLCTWVRGMVTYYELIKTVLPKRQALHYQQEKMQRKQEQLEKAEAALALTSRTLQTLRDQFNAAQRDKSDLETSLANIRVRLLKADALTRDLSGEERRWKAELQSLRAELTSTVGDACLTVACCVFGGPHFHGDRKALLEHWRYLVAAVGLSTSLPPSGTATPMSQLLDFGIQMEWKNQGLPSDDNSQWSAFVVAASTRDRSAAAAASRDGAAGTTLTTARDAASMSTSQVISALGGERVVFLIDPDGQAREWVSQRELPNGALMLSGSDEGAVAADGSASLKASLLYCLQHGKPLIVTDVSGSLPQILRPLLTWRPDATPKDKYAFIGAVPIDGIEVGVRTGFALYVLTRESRPGSRFLTTELASSAAVVNFSLTYEALTMQLTDIVVFQEHSELEWQRQGLARSMDALATQVSDGGAASWRRIKALRCADCCIVTCCRADGVVEPRAAGAAVERQGLRRGQHHAHRRAAGDQDGVCGHRGEAQERVGRDAPA